MSALSRFLGEDAAAILSGKAFPDIAPPDGLDVCDSTGIIRGNAGIEEVAKSAIDAEIAGVFQRMRYSP